jgi:putative transposase
MSYVGFYGIGYQTGLASSDDLITWKREGCILRRDAASPVTRYNVAMNWIVRDNAVHSAGSLKRVKDRFLGAYHAYPKTGYEQGPAVIGVGHQNVLNKANQRVGQGQSSIRLMVTILSAILAYLRAFVVSRHTLALEAVALRQQLAVYKRKQPRAKLDRFDRRFWVVLRRLWKDWSEALILVKPGTVVCWHRAGYRLFWRWRSRALPAGRPKVAEEVRQLMRRMRRENPTWGAPRIHGELLLLGFEISEPSVSRYLRRLKRIPGGSRAKQWLAFLNNHREVIAAFDFLTVPTLSFRTLYCFFAIEHGRRRILHFNVTLHPTSDWIVQQLREAFPLACPYRYVLFDHDAKFGKEVLNFLKSSDLEPVRPSVRSPWQNGIAERWVGSARRELLDHIIPLNEYLPVGSKYSRCAAIVFEQPA